MCEVESECVFVDLQGFRGINNQFIIKEFSLLDIDYEFYNIVKSPYSMEKLPPHLQNQAKWLTRYYHGISFNSGELFLNEVIREVLPHIQNKVIIVKGEEKVSWVKSIFRRSYAVENVENFGWHSHRIQTTIEKCQNHTCIRIQNDSCHCARVSVENLKENWHLIKELV